jgi:hypothetical protein
VASTVYQTSTASAITALTAPNEISLSVTAGTANTILGTATVATSASNAYYATFNLGSGPGTLDWSTLTGDYPAVFDVTTSTSTVTVAGNGQRLNSTGTVQLSSVVTTGQAGTGLKTFDVTGTFNSNVARATSDIYVLASRLSNSSSMTTGSFAQRVDNSSVTAGVPWTVAGATTKSPPFDMTDQRVRRNSLLRR